MSSDAELLKHCAEELQNLIQYQDMDRYTRSAIHIVLKNLDLIISRLTPEPSVEALKLVHDTLGTYLAVKASQAEWEHQAVTLRKLIRRAARLA